MIGITMLKMALVCAATHAAQASRALRPGGVLAAVLLLAAGPPVLAAPPAPGGSQPVTAPATSDNAVAQAGPQPTAPTTPQSLQDQSMEAVKKKAAEAGLIATPQAPAAAPAPAPGVDTRGLDQDIQGLKKDVVDLNKDLFVLEEELLFPANTQVAVFLSVDVGDFFALDSVQLKIDQKEVINYLYTPREVEALLKGGVQRLYLGNLKVGQHELVAFFNGKGPNDRAYKRGASIRFDKGVGAKYLELKIDDRQKKLEPEFEIKDWE
jgi:hypothetical protein